MKNLLVTFALFLICGAADCQQRNIRTGKPVGHDSLYIFDNKADCESEGFIRFRDKKSDKAGIFNRNGEIVIPAEYDDLTRVMNGMAAALKGAEKKSAGGDNRPDEEHFIWTGGTEFLIDTSNNILVDGFHYGSNLNFYSLRISDQPDPDEIRLNFLGTDGKFYSFIDFEKEFLAWLKETLLDECTNGQLLAASYPEVTWWKEPDGWITEPKRRFFKKNSGVVQAKLLEMNSPDCEYGISIEGLNPFIYSSYKYNGFYTSCGEPKDWIFPVMNIILTHQDPEGIIQDHLDFLRTGKGYKLIGISFAKGEIR